MRDNIKQLLKELPSQPGVYFHKDSLDNIIYVGKAANLNNRVKQYFQNGRFKDPKTVLLVDEIADIEWQVTSGEAEALFLEAELIKRYQPKYNILLRDDKSSVYVRINTKDFAPSVSLTRRPLDDGAEYFGPFLAAWQVRRALRYLRKAFPFSIHTTLPSRACLDVHLGLCPGPETTRYNRQEYLLDLKKLIQYIRGSRQSVLKSLELQMVKLSKQQKYEEAARFRNRLNALKALQNQVIFGDREALDISKDHALSEITILLGLKAAPRRIEAYDISHLQGTDTVASMVVFNSGIADKSAYRKFKMRTQGNDDFAHMEETLTRRFSQINLKKWPKPDLIIIDGGRGQLSSAQKILKNMKVDLPSIGLAKRYEEIIISNSDPYVEINSKELKKLKGLLFSSEAYTTVNLPITSNVIKLLQRIRDESHRFAVSYHSVLRSKRQTASIIEEIPGFGPTSRKNLIKEFGSLQAIKTAKIEEIAKVVGNHKAVILKKYLENFQK